MMNSSHALAALLCAFPAVAMARPSHCGELSGELNVNTSENLSWPAITRESRPWTRWWWMGSAVSEAEITRHLELFHEAGIGGVEISPIYGAGGPDEAGRDIPFLSDHWMQMLAHTLREAKRLGMGVDMISGTGWPLGGPWVQGSDAPSHIIFETLAVQPHGASETVRSKSKPSAKLLALAASSANGQTLDLMGKVDAAGNLDWRAPAGQWTLHAAFATGTNQQVKRAAPGGEGNVLDHFSGAATGRYLAHFDAPLARLPAEEMPRCFFNDSYEVFGANWTDDLLAQFERRRGYDLRRYLWALSGQGEADMVRRLRSDYRQTVGDLLLEGFVRTWTGWARDKGARSRYQAHGSPGNLLDLYAASDIPETEVFGTAWLELAGLDPLPGTPRQYGGREEVLACKLASSAAHIAGKPLCSSESFTWLGEHGKVPLEHIKAEADCLFVMGINHVFFHGSTFSPAAAGWPGWMFYASTHFGPTNPFWRDLPALNTYLARCQSFLQAGRPDNDVLLYLPFADLLGAQNGAKYLLQFMTVHNTAQWLDGSLPDFARTGHLLWDRGYGFDAISDDLLQKSISVEGGMLQARGAAYRTLIVPRCTFMPPETLERLVELARGGATILIVGDLPADVPGLGDLDTRRRRLNSAKTAIRAGLIVDRATSGAARYGVGKGRFLIGADLESLLAAAHVPRESIVDNGVEFIRRRGDDGSRHYFFTNLGREALHRWVPLAVEAQGAVLFDPMQGRRGLAALRQHEGRAEVYLQMAPGESLLLRALPLAVDGPSWDYLSPLGEGQTISGPWRVEFIEGAPALPKSAEIETLASWTQWPQDAGALRAFSGTARYSTTFDCPPGAADAWALDLGQVCHSARVRLNGHDLGTLYARPFRLRLPTALHEKGNRLEIEVTNLMANSLADLDRRKVPWHPFFFVNIEYKPFDAAAWEPLPSGLFGPVRLVPLRMVPLRRHDLP